MMCGVNMYVPSVRYLDIDQQFSLKQIISVTVSYIEHI